MLQDCYAHTGWKYMPVHVLKQAKFAHYISSVINQKIVLCCDENFRKSSYTRNLYNE